MMVSFATQNPFNFRSSHLLIVGLNASAILVLFRKSPSFAKEFKPFLHFLFSQIQGIWPYVEVLDPLEVLCKVLDTYLFAFFYMQNPVSPALFVEDAFFFLPFYVSDFFIKTRCLSRSVFMNQQQSPKISILDLS